MQALDVHNLTVLQLKANYILVKQLRDKSGWGWDDEEKHIVVEDSVWEAYLQVCSLGLAVNGAH
jgi:hypothetical protein